MKRITYVLDVTCDIDEAVRINELVARMEQEFPRSSIAIRDIVNRRLPKAVEEELTMSMDLNGNITEEVIGDPGGNVGTAKRPRES